MPDSDPFDLTGLDKKQRYRVRQVMDRPNLTKAKRRELVTALVARLRSPSDLEQRAEAVRTDCRRAGQLRRFSEDVRQGNAIPPQFVAVPPSPPRYSLDCVDCDHVIRLHSPKPRQPLCSLCKRKREAKRRPRAEVDL
mgnify:CR=1 FL=1